MLAQGLSAISGQQVPARLRVQAPVKAGYILIIMGDDKKDSGLIGRIKEGLGYVAHRILANIALPITESVEKGMQDIEARTIRIEERAVRKMFSFAVIGFGAAFMLVALFFFLRESLGWSNSEAYSSIGALMLIIGLLLNAGERRD